MQKCVTTLGTTKTLKEIQSLSRTIFSKASSFGVPGPYRMSEKNAAPTKVTKIATRTDEIAHRLITRKN